MAGVDGHNARDEEYRRLTVGVRQELLAALPPTSEWDNVSVEWTHVGGTEYVTPINVLGYGRAWSVATPSGLSSRLLALKRFLATPDRGAPVALAVFVSSEGVDAGIDMNFDRRVILDTTGAPAYNRPLGAEEVRPTRDEWVRELELHPRSADRVPDWWRSILAGGDTGTRPQLPDWFGDPMPQSLEEAESSPRVILPKFERLLEREGYADIVDDLVAAIHAEARALPATELDAIFGRNGRAAQTQAQQRLAEAATEAISPRLAERSADEAAGMIRSWHKISRASGPDPDLDTGAQLRVAVAGFAGRIIMRRFGTLPKDWHVA
ncbi:hypothetical protein GCM10011490_03040 [Pseudoclavibacter endophyticus]|uniref:Uncharacterized protein n=1 Tax=Pseudoclavibacter endophyticus TaxID=1778590 RepID=A0A6H9WMR9_9MICO|nr:hypothetical protein [Pseudoclavibacter endophyticus]KAB1650166.1 hypothetical protein F8O04_08190 [Pseudoclavibacter endophyticus]GGA56594.1 hypothetical protein GCM10011490_03040 [Pseudoclavibacter endophyticus]